MRRSPAVAVILAWTGCLCARALGSVPPAPTVWRPRLTGSADWELFSGQGESQGTTSSSDAFLQRYSVDLGGVLWDPRFNRYSLGVDLFRSTRDVDGDRNASSSLGYRASTTFFPQRAFPLLLFARRFRVDSSGQSLADSNRETAAWGAEWNVATSERQRLRFQFDKSSYDLVSPIALRERRRTGAFEFTRSFEDRELSVRYGLQDQKELVNGSDFERQDLNLSDRTRFDNGATLVFLGNRTLSDARYSSGLTDTLTLDRFSTVLDLPNPAGSSWNMTYDYNGTKGQFVDSTSHTLSGRMIRRIGTHWDSSAGASWGLVGTDTASGRVDQNQAGLSLGVRYSRDWSRFHLGTGYALGLERSRFSNEPDRTLTSHSADAEVRVPLAGRSQAFSSLAWRQDQNDTTGVGYSFDEARATAGIEVGFGEALVARASAYRRETTYDTFQFGVQRSRETGLEGGLDAISGGVSLALSTRRGVSDFVPDPAAGSPFTPGTDLVNRADIATVAAYWRFGRSWRLRAQGRLERREFTSIGEETVAAYGSEAEWTWRVWVASLGITHYGRDNSTTFSQDTLVLKVGRRFF